MIFYQQIKIMFKVLALVMVLFPLSLVAEDEAVTELMQEYLDFAEYGEGIISKEQLAEIDVKDIYYIDVRNPDAFASGHLAGAVNIEWRELLARRDEIPSDKTVVLYCDTGLLSSKAQLYLKLAGINTKVLYGGYFLATDRLIFNPNSR